jgi:hypothetical protein
MIFRGYLLHINKMIAYPSPKNSDRLSKNQPTSDRLPIPTNNDRPSKQKTTSDRLSIPKNSDRPSKKLTNH